MSLSRTARLIEATNPVLTMIDSLFSQQEERNQVVYEMASRIPDPEPDIGEREPLNQITGGLS
ncbi:MAG: hypothetical protein EON59_03795 [Alphaproteobacteria bacterium]|nr:MAG: hypothetical protein EON59_03795 [Alphaproteobacteria bacterium]